MTAPRAASDEQRLSRAGRWSQWSQAWGLATVSGISADLRWRFARRRQL